MKSNIFLKAGVCSLLCSGALYAELLLPSQAYNLAVQNSHTIKSTKFDLEGKKEELNQHIAKKYPQLDFSIDHNKSFFERNELLGFSNPDFTETSTDYTLTLNQSIFNKELDKQVELEKKRIELYDLKLQQEIQELSKEVLNAYLLALGTQSKIEFLKSLVKYNEQKFTSIEKKFKMKLSNKIDYLQAKVELVQAQADLKKEKKLLDVYLVKLKQYTLLDNVQIPKINFENFNIKSVFDQNSFMNDNTIDSNLQVIQSQKEIEFSNLEIESAKSAYYPKLTFDARYTKYISDDMTTDYEQMKRVSLKLQIPLYKGGALRSKIKSSKIKQKSTVENFEFIKQELLFKNEELKTILTASLESIDIYKETLVSTESYLEFVTLGYENGLKSIVDLYEAKNKLFEIKYQYINSVQEFINSYVEYLVVNNKINKLKELDNMLSS